MPNNRVPANQLNLIKREHILLAIRDLDAGVTHSFDESIEYDLVHEGVHYPPKAVLGVAGRSALGVELLPKSFSAGEHSTCFRVLRREGSEIVRKRRAFLLTWNPSRYTLEQFRDYLLRLGGSGNPSWSVGPRKDLPVGSRLYIMRLGVEPKGIVAVGVSTAGVEELPHWDPDRRKRGDTTRSVSYRPLRIQEEPFVPLAELISRWPGFEWTPQGSGNEIHDPEVIAYLDGYGSARSEQVSIPEEIDTDEVFEEGSVTRITVNAYERDPGARRRCLEHHGYRCAGCNRTMSEIYGPIAEGIIHVHHRTPLHTIGKSYVVDPINDLVPVCPNCHAVIHRDRPAMSIERLRTLLQMAE